MAAAREAKPKASPVQTLLFAWVLVVALAFAPAGAYYYSTGNLLFLVSFTTAVFVLGLSLMIALALARAGTPRRREVDAIANVRRRGAIFGKR